MISLIAFCQNLNKISSRFQNSLFVPRLENDYNGQTFKFLLNSLEVVKYPAVTSEPIKNNKLGSI